MMERSCDTILLRGKIPSLREQHLTQVIALHQQGVLPHFALLEEANHRSYGRPQGHQQIEHQWSRTPFLEAFLFLVLDSGVGQPLKSTSAGVPNQSRSAHNIRHWTIRIFQPLQMNGGRTMMALTEDLGLAAIRTSSPSFTPEM